MALDITEVQSFAFLPYTHQSPLELLSSTLAESNATQNSAIVLISDTQSGEYLLEDISDYSPLTSLPWYTTDSMAIAPSDMEADALANALATQLQLSIVHAQIPASKSASYAAAASEFGFDYHPYTLNAMDAALLLTQAYTQSLPTGATVEAIASALTALTSQSASYEGYSGSVILDANGDRAEVSYDYWQLQGANADTASWKLIGSYP